jgi:primosomal protein N' (replication factor Y)
MKMMINTDDQTIYHVAVPSPLRRLFDYLAPEQLQNASCNKILQPGTRVLVPFGKRVLVGIIVGNSKTSSIPISRLKFIKSIIDTEPLIPRHLFDLYIWAAKYYHNPIGDSLFQSIPNLLRKGKELPSLETQCWMLTKKGIEVPLTDLSRSPKKREFISWLKEKKAITIEEVKQKKFHPQL